MEDDKILELENNYKAEIAELEDNLYNVIIQACQDKEGLIDNQNIHLYRLATALLARRERLINIDDRLYKINYKR